ncbi:lectin like domain-containing protein [Methanobacterium sp. SMA-27]|uniref:lectin like domain-containing protein n=1 Tax=Methanobacterium sp. SMA-27 TaxID=1495336 RepID=UPI0006948ADF|nr:lectin like domain-containing protein [Methanobacterium sp. SMA-27]
MGISKTQFIGFILVLGLFLSLVFPDVISAAEVSNNTHLNPVKESTAVHNNATSVKKSNSSSTTKSKSTDLPCYYDLRKLGKLTPVKQQGFSGTCWAFAALGSLESCLLPYETWNFSENNMKNLDSYNYAWGFDRGYNDAGSWEQALAYLTRYSGPVISAEDPFNEFSGSSPTGLKAVKHVQNAILIGARNSTSHMDNDKIKEAIMKYGAVYSLMRYSDYYFNPWTNAYYYNGSNDVNHAIDIVGWDDNYNKSNFLNDAPGNGAFIIRNSWGTDWGDNGYFYVSYYDKLLGNSNDNVVFMDAEPITNYNNIYQYDPLGYVGSFGFDSDVGWFSNVFTSRSNEKLRASSFYVLTPNSLYDLYVYLNPKGNNPISGKLALFKEGIISTAGYTTIDFGKHISLLKGHKFSIVVKLTTPNSTLPITIEYPMEYYSSKATANPGESYVSMNGIFWEDMTSFISNANVCLKAFTSSRGADLSVTKEMSNKNPILYSKIFYTITVKNNGPGTAENVFISDKLPLGLSFLSYITHYGKYNPKTGVWNIGTLPNGEVATIIINCIVKGTANISNEAILFSSTYDPNLNNNFAMINGTVLQQRNVKKVVQKLIPIEKWQNIISMQKTGQNLIPFVFGLIIMVGGITLYSKK